MIDPPYYGPKDIRSDGLLKAAKLKQRDQFRKESNMAKPIKTAILLRPEKRDGKIVKKQDDVARCITEDDKYIGGRLKERRQALRISQEKLADMIGLTFQQVQKYERAANRVSASRLLQIARILETPVTYFLPDFETRDDIASSWLQDENKHLRSIIQEMHDTTARLAKSIKPVKVKKK